VKHGLRDVGRITLWLGRMALALARLEGIVSLIAICAVSGPESVRRWAVTVLPSYAKVFHSGVSYKDVDHEVHMYGTEFITPALEEALRDPSDEIRLLAMDSLGKIKAKFKKSIYLALLEDSVGVEVKIAAVNRLVSCRDKEIDGILSNLICEETTPAALRKEIIQKIGEFCLSIRKACIPVPATFQVVQFQEALTVVAKRHPAFAKDPDFLATSQWLGKMTAERKRHEERIQMLTPPKCTPKEVRAILQETNDLESRANAFAAISNTNRQLAFEVLVDAIAQHPQEGERAHLYRLLNCGFSTGQITWYLDEQFRAEKNPRIRRILMALMPKHLTPAIQKLVADASKNDPDETVRRRALQILDSNFFQGGEFISSRVAEEWNLEDA
jgi:hypothetical protein